MNRNRYTVIKVALLIILLIVIGLVLMVRMNSNLIVTKSSDSSLTVKRPLKKSAKNKSVNYYNKRIVLEVLEHEKIDPTTVFIKSYDVKTGFYNMPKIYYTSKRHFGQIVVLEMRYKDKDLGDTNIKKHYYFYQKTWRTFITELDPKAKRDSSWQGTWNYSYKLN